MPLSLHSFLYLEECKSKLENFDRCRLGECGKAHSREQAAAISEVLATLLDGNHYWVGAKGQRRPLGVADILEVAPYNAQVSLLKRTLPEGVRVGTMDRFQGQEAPLVVYSMRHPRLRMRREGWSFFTARTDSTSQPAELAAWFFYLARRSSSNQLA